MVLTAAQTKNFFEQAGQMGIPNDTVDKMAEEGITAVADLAEFKDAELEQLAENLRKPSGRIEDPNNG